MCACCGFERGGLGDVECYCDRSALYTLAHNLAVGAALVAAYEAGYRDRDWKVSDDDYWRPNVEGKEMPR